jgi:hypothetical protein
MIGGNEIFVLSIPFFIHTCSLLRKHPRQRRNSQPIGDNNSLYCAPQSDKNLKPYNDSIRYIQSGRNVVTIKNVQEVCHLTPKSAGDLVSLFEQEKLLVEFTGQFRNRFFL